MVQTPASNLKSCNKSKWLTQKNHVAMKITNKKSDLFPTYPTFDSTTPVFIVNFPYEVGWS